jgi:hypothetical protein
MKKGPWRTMALAPAVVSQFVCQFGDFLRGAHRASGLEALPAEHRASLGGLKRNGGFLATLGASSLSFRPDLPAASRATAFGPLGFACLAALGFVLKTLVGEKHLFASGKNELGATLATLQNLIVEFHGRLPWTPIGQQGPA